MWDDELERLTNYVTDMLGEEAFNSAVTRAVATVKGRAGEPIAGDSGEVPESATESELVYEALREELRRLARPQ